MKTSYKGAIRDIYSEAANSYTQSSITKLEEVIENQVDTIVNNLKDILGYKEFTQTKALIDSLASTIAEKAFEVGFKKGMSVILDGLTQ